MRILFDQVVHDHKNRGNNSLLEVTRNRFREFWPQAEIDVISISPYFCKIYLDDVHPVDPVSFSKYTGRFDLFYKYIPKSIWRLIFELRELIKKKSGLEITTKHAGKALEDSNRLSDSRDKVDDSAQEDSLEAYPEIAQYDLYVPTGGGYMCDSDKRFLLPLFDKLETASARGVITVMVGQGIGPIEDPELIERAGQVLPKLDYLLIREEKLTRPLLNSLGVPPEKILMTGDDAIELAYKVRKNKMGSGMGLSLRVAAYTDFNQKHIDRIRPVVFNVAGKYNAELIAAPIDVNDLDKEYTEKLMDGYRKTSSSWKKFESISEVIERIGRCRIMITGTFHGAVFALSQGIPVIGLANSIEYKNKLSGLATEFGEAGCQIIDLKVENFEALLLEAIDHAWLSAEQLRPHLLDEAKRQIGLGYDAYRKIQSLVNARKSL